MFQYPIEINHMEFHNKRIYRISHPYDNMFNGQSLQGFHDYRNGSANRDGLYLV